MLQSAKKAEEQAVLQVADMMCAAVRTAPKGKGVDNLFTCVVTGEEKDALAAEMERLGPELGYGFFQRDAGNIRASQAVVLVGSEYRQRGLGESCSLCNHKGCAGCAKDGGVCAFDTVDLGIALGSAAALASSMHIDNRIMFSAGKAAQTLGYVPESIKIVMAIPLSVSGKSPFFDR